MDSKIRISSRSSPLALAQTYFVIDLLVQKNPHLNKDSFQVQLVQNAQGDVNLHDALYAMSQTGVFTKAVQKLILENEADFAVHSLKDLPTLPDPVFVLAAVSGLSKRGDCVIFNKKHNVKSLSELQEGAIVGTSSMRRICCLKQLHPHLTFQNIRGNIQTRLKKLESNEYDAVIMAQAALDRLGMSDIIGQELNESDIMYAPGQGALGIECKSNDEKLIQLLKTIDDYETRRRTEEERRLLNKLEGGCKLPIAVHSYIQNQQLYLKAKVWNVDDNNIFIEANHSGNINDQTIGFQLAENMINHPNSKSVLHHLFKEKDNDKN